MLVEVIDMGGIGVKSVIGFPFITTCYLERGGDLKESAEDSLYEEV